LNGIECTSGSFAIANSSDDGNAANMVAKVTRGLSNLRSRRR
jgi:hypothetical protein